MQIKKRHYIQEDIARDLYQDLTWRLAAISSQIEVKVMGRGVHWNCSIQFDEYSIVTHCFEDRSSEYRGSEYDISFKSEEQTIASGRTSSKELAISSIESWLKHHDIEKLYKRFPFIDKRKRALIGIRDTIVSQFPELTSSPAIELIVKGDNCELISRSGNRHCEILGWVRGEQIYANFFWDNRQMFKFEGIPLHQFVAVLKSWIYQASMTSEMRVEFPWLEFGKLADYYEQGKPIEGDFIESWDSIERFYESLKSNYGFKPNVGELLAQMRDAGYDKTLRAGQSMSTLMLSRSRQHGLRGEQAFISFHFNHTSMDVTFDFKGQEKHHYQEIFLTPPLSALLDRLVAMDIDEPR